MLLIGNGKLILWVSVSDDDEIDYSIKPEFYHPSLDDKDELWVQKKRSGRTSDAILSCPACFTTLCLDCQRHEKYCTQYRAMFVVNCKIESSDILRPSSRKRQRKMVPRVISEDTGKVTGDQAKVAPLRPVCCSVCGTEVGALDEDEVYHFFDVLPSES
ncbi:E2F-associated phosphoprotein [Nymphaea thermarum]|nr:E2F-associated phosphoprotein [Nymphaea thermarum]